MMHMDQKDKTNIRLIAFDLDGTFLDRTKNIPEENMQALAYAASCGIVLVPATGRLYSGLPEVLRTLPFLRYFILINGAKVYDAQDDRILHTAELSNSTALSLFAHAEGIGCLYDCYLRDEGLMTRALYDRLDDFVEDRIYVEYMKRIRRPVEDLPSLIKADGGPVQKVQYFFLDKAERLRQLALLPKQFPGIQATSSMPMNIEINSGTAGKGSALEALCRHLGFTAKNALAFGDGTNDLDMILAAGIGAAMSNSDEALLSAADLVTACDNDHAGMGKTIFDLLKQ